MRRVNRASTTRRELAERALAILSGLERRLAAHHYVDKEGFEAWLWRLPSGCRGICAGQGGLPIIGKFPRAVARPLPYSWPTSWPGCATEVLCRRRGAAMG
ncbi:MAG: hypothetical protein QXS00_07670 [Pyrobaculum sp.]|uniref:hypothetical protein n=1 Tax=Pyrobaculum sp. TaxID=2004705 RepID=UPI003161378F